MTTEPQEPTHVQHGPYAGMPRFGADGRLQVVPRARLYFGQNALLHNLPSEYNLRAVVATQDPVGIFLIVESPTLPEIPYDVECPSFPGHLNHMRIDLSRLVELYDADPKGEALKDEVALLAETARAYPIWHSPPELSI